MQNSNLEIDLFILKRGDMVVGFGLRAQPHQASENFCSSFARHLARSDPGTAITVHGNKLTFSYPGEGQVQFTVPTPIAVAINSLLEADRDDPQTLELSLSPRRLTPAFQVALHGLDFEPIEEVVASSKS